MACPMNFDKLDARDLNKVPSPAPSSSSVSEVNEKIGAPIKPTFTKNDCLDPNFVPHQLRRIGGESILLSAGALAILLQVAHPGVGAGVNEHSNFAYRVQDRLRTTMTYVSCMAFGTPEEKNAIVQLIHRAHADIKGTLQNPSNKGQAYAADDPHLQLWVAATLFASAIQTYERVFGPLPAADREQAYKEYSILACALRVEPEMWPATQADFWRYWDEMLRTIEVTDNAKQVADDLLYLRQAPWYMRMWMPSIRLVTAEWMPERLRNDYGLKTSGPRRAAYKGLHVFVKAVYPALPTKLRTYTTSYYMKDMRKRMSSNQGVIGKA